jgi:hypothetical protein
LKTPPEPVALTVHSPPVLDAQALKRRTLSGRLKMLLVLLACAAPVLASYFTYYVIRPDARTNYGELILPTRALPASLSLVSLEGEAVPVASLRGQWLLVVVGPADCDAACDQRLFTQRRNGNFARCWGGSATDSTRSGWSLTVPRCVQRCAKPWRRVSPHACCAYRQRILRPGCSRSRGSRWNPTSTSSIRWAPG